MTAPSHADLQHSTTRRLRNALLAGGYVLVCLIWGTNWIAIKIAVTDMTPMLAAGLRFMLAAPVIAVICRLTGTPIRFHREQRRFAVLVTVGYFAIPYLLLNAAEQHISSGLTAICFSMISIGIVGLGVPILGTRIGLLEVVGVLIAVGFLALLILSLDEVGATSGAAIAAALAAAGMHALSYVLIKKHGAYIHPLTLNMLPVFGAGIALVLGSVMFEHPGRNAFTTTSVLATAHLALVASVVGLVVYFALLQRLSALTMSLVFVVFPLVAQLLSHLTDGIEISASQYAIIAAIVAGMAITLIAQHQRTRSEVAELPGDSPWSPSSDQLAQMYAEASARYPAEACGYCGDGSVTICTNELADSQALGTSVSTRSAETGYVFAAADLIAMDRSFDSDDPALLIFHSHPDVGAYLSAEDRAFAIVDGHPAFPVMHLVIDATADGVRGSRLFVFDPDVADYVERDRFGDPHPLEGGV